MPSLKDQEQTTTAVGSASRRAEVDAPVRPSVVTSDQWHFVRLHFTLRKHEAVGIPPHVVVGPMIQRRRVYFSGVYLATHHHSSTRYPVVL